MSYTFTGPDEVPELLAALRGEGRDGAAGQRVFSGGSRALKGVEVLVRMLRSAP